jgi:SAM-dependent methyltransferase
MKPSQIAKVKSFGRKVQFGETAADYRRHRAGFPPVFFDRLQAAGFAEPGQMALDIGTGTGSIALGLAELGLRMTGLDPAAALLAQAAERAEGADLSVAWTKGEAEALPFDAQQFDLVTAGQCWHWFDRPKAAAEAYRVLKPGGALVIAHFDWVPLTGNVVAETEALILQANPDWAMSGGTGLYPAWLTDMAQAGFMGLETASTDMAVPYSHADWRGRVRASAGVRASLSEAEVDQFDARLARILGTGFPDDPLAVPHRLWWAIGHRPL